MYTGAEERGPLGLTLQTHTQAQVSAQGCESAIRGASPGVVRNHSCQPREHRLDDLLAEAFEPCCCLLHPERPGIAAVPHARGGDGA